MTSFFTRWSPHQAKPGGPRGQAFTRSSFLLPARISAAALLIINPSLFLQSRPAFDLPEKKAVELYSSHSPDALVTEETGVFGLVSNMVQMGQVPEKCQGVVGMTCLSLYLRAQALSRLLRNGARVEVRVLPGSICDLGVAAVTESADQAKRLGSRHLSKASEAREGGGFAAFGGVTGVYDRIHTTNVMDYVGPLNLLLTVGSLLKVGAPHAVMKANIMLDFLKYLRSGPSHRLISSVGSVTS